VTKAREDRWRKPRKVVPPLPATQAGPIRLEACDLRLGVNASILGVRPSGLGVYTADLVREFGRHWNDGVIYTSSPDGLYADRATLRKVSPMVRPERRPVGNVLRILWLQSVLRARILKDRIHVLLNTVPEGMLAPPVPQVTVVHDLLPLLRPQEYPRQQLYFRFVVPALLRCSTLIVADSENTRHDIITRYGIPPAKVRTVYIGYDRARFHSGLERRGTLGLAPGSYILYLGNLLPHKNIARLIEGFGMIASTTTCRLVIGGARDPRYFPALWAKTAALGLEGRVTFLDYVPSAELPALYANAALGVWPSLYEGFGLPPLEAMACGTPVVVSHAGSLSEVVGDAAILVDPNDAKSVADAITRLLTNEGLRMELRERGLARCQQFSWDETARRTLRLCEEAYEGSKRK
jgi:glycosyltransferase involved in cell wall biosynthesis